MTEKRYFKRMWEDEYYIFDSYTISEKDFDEKVEYEDYQAFADSMTGEEVVGQLNELYEELDYWKKRALLLENKYNEGDSIKWLRENTVWEQMPTSKPTVTKTHLRPKKRKE